MVKGRNRQDDMLFDLVLHYNRRAHSRVYCAHNEMIGSRIPDACKTCRYTRNTCYTHTQYI